MSSCSSIEPLVTPYVDNELDPTECGVLEYHLDKCPPCRSRVEAERSVRTLLQERRQTLHQQRAPGSLRVRCASLSRKPVPERFGPLGWIGGLLALRPVAARLAPLTVAATLVMLVGGAFVYRVTDSSPTVMAAELTADHVKCFVINAVLRTKDSPDAVESSLASGFNWNMHVPADAEREGLELVGSRPCLYGEGKVAHIMFRHNGRPVSLFMLPRSQRPDQLVKVFGHEAAIWSVGDRTFVLIAREGRSEVERMAAFIHAAIE
jgi:anti-sigma factor RsiW